MKDYTLTPLACGDESRRQIIRDRSLNGVDYVDVRNGDATHPPHLCVHFLTGIPPEFLPQPKQKQLTGDEKARALRRIVIRGGRRITGITAKDFQVDRATDRFEESCLGIDVDYEGDWSSYTLCFVELDEKGRPTGQPLNSLDPRYACLDFTFRTECPAEIDCKTGDACSPPVSTVPPISYLAKDYPTFRQLILDRLALVMPDWRERHAPDIGIALVEVLAYTADYLSYYQDSVGTEQYLDTARQRISVRRHARLIDYVMHDGCNARAFVHVRMIDEEREFQRRDIYFVTRPPGSNAPAVLEDTDLKQLQPGWLAFELLAETPTVTLYKAHNAIRIYTWGNEECCLPRGATRATLLDESKERDEHDPYDATLCSEDCVEEPPPLKKPTNGKPNYDTTIKDHEHYEGCGCPPPPPPPRPARPLHLEVGDFLLFEELACGGTAFNFDPDHPEQGGFDGEKSLPDADRTHRHVVRLTKVTPSCDALLGNRVLEVEWSREDALPFALCISAVGVAPNCDLVKNMAVARGNILIVDEGLHTDEDLDPVPSLPVIDVCDDVETPAEIALIPARYRPQLKKGPLTFAEPLLAGAPAAALMQQDPRGALPWVTLESSGDAHADGTWFPRADLLASSGDDTHFVAEVDDRGFAHLRFGDGDAGRAVETGMTFKATYRAGNGREGLVGPESIVHIVFRPNTVTAKGAIESVRNPLPAGGAVDPESIAAVKTYAPSGVHRPLQRAVTADDYAALARSLRYPERDPRVQGANGRLLWNGSWYEAGVSIDPFGASDLDASLQDSITRRVQPFRRMGHDLRVAGAGIVPIRLELLELCVQPHYLRAHVLSAVRDVLSNRALPDGRLGFFHPDNLTFGAAVYVSRIVAAVMAVDGVANVCVESLERLDRTKNSDFKNGLLKLRPNEIARLDNDASLPENGVLSFSDVRGGR